MLIKGFEIAFSLHQNTLTWVDTPEDLRHGDSFHIGLGYGVGRNFEASFVENLSGMGNCDTNTNCIGVVIKSSLDVDLLYQEEVIEAAKAGVALYEYVRTPLVLSKTSNLVVPFESNRRYLDIASAALKRNTLEDTISIIKRGWPEYYRDAVIVDVRDVFKWLTGKVKTLTYRRIEQPEGKTIYVDIKPLPEFVAEKKGSKPRVIKRSLA